MNQTNHLFDIASELVLYTNSHLFLTGKAGTGKTTFLRKIQRESSKKTAVVAPTGVAAINAGGVTMHSFFQLPFEPFVPARGFAPEHTSVANINNLFKKIRLSAVKREVLEELELLIIDEVSMLRSDQLDCIDTILKGVRRNQRPFGGVQLLLIGDLYQLPPVVTDSDKQILDDHYASPFFFEAKALQTTPLLHVELDTVYRQQEQRFVDLLNKVRHTTLDADDVALLRERYAPHFRPDSNYTYITITSHNYKADAINQRELQLLEGERHVFTGELSGDFGEKNFPTDKELVLKTGAQVMFVKNDVGEQRRYYNGKLAIVQRIHGNEITVCMKDDGTELVLQQEEWKNIRYTFNKETDTMEEEELGSFRQYPVRLAWAITIHKSQGLTFDKVVIDAGQSFAAGQVYVALSRCTTLDGLVLLSPIHSGSISTEPRIVEFSARTTPLPMMEEVLKKEKITYMNDRLLRAFELQAVMEPLKLFPELLMSKDVPQKQATYQQAQQMLAAALEMDAVVARFRLQLQELLEADSPDMVQLQDRVSKATHWLAAQYGQKILQPMAEHLDVMQGAKRIKGYLKEIKRIYAILLQYMQQLSHLDYHGHRFIKEGELDTYLPQQHPPTAKARKSKGEKAPKGATYILTYEMFRAGKSPEVIAAERNLAPTTIESHLARLVGEGKLLVTEVLNEEKINVITAAIRSEPQLSLTDLKRKLSDDISFGDIRTVQSHLALSDK